MCENTNPFDMHVFADHAKTVRLVLTRVPGTQTIVPVHPETQVTQTEGFLPDGRRAVWENGDWVPRY